MLKSKTNFLTVFHISRYGHAKENAIINIFGDWDASYKVLPGFNAAIEKYSGSIVMWQFEQLQNSAVEAFGVFHRAFCAIPPSIEGFKCCIKPLNYIMNQTNKIMKRG